MIVPAILAALVVIGGAAETIRRRRSRATKPSLEASSDQQEKPIMSTRADAVAPSSRSDRSGSAGEDTSDEVALIQTDQRDSKTADRATGSTREDLAQVPPRTGSTRGDPDPSQDQSPPRTSHPKPASTDPPKVALIQLHVRDLVIWRFALDGGTAWTVPRPPGGFPIEVVIKRAIAARLRAIELHDPGGHPVPVRIRFEAGRTIVQTGATRIDMLRKHAEVVITSSAIEVEGEVAWFVRELPRAVWWLLGVDLTTQDCPACLGLHPAVRTCSCTRGRRPWPSWRELADELARAGVEQLRIEQAIDCSGLPIVPGFAEAIIAGQLPVTPRLVKTEATGINVGDRKHPETLAVYRKDWEIAAKRTDRTALLEAITAAGWDGQEPWTRVEARSQDHGLVLVQDGEVVVDARHPGSALDPRTRAALWRRVLGRVWLSDTRSRAAEPRDRPRSPAWEQLLDAAPRILDEQGAQVAMISRAASRQLESVRGHHADQLGVSAVTLGVLDGGRDLDEIATLARAELERQLAPAIARERSLSAAAKYRSLLEAAQAEAVAPGLHDPQP